VNVGEVLRRSTEHLGTHGSETPRLDAELLLAHALSLSRIELYTAFDKPLTSRELEAARVLVARRARREPLQYVLGEWGFRRLTLAVDQRALIPRPETEVLVERALARLRGRDAPRVLDVGTGCGAVALSIADEHPGARVTAIDVSEQALALAACNQARTGIEVALLRADVFEGLPEGPWDLVVSNPPYVLAAELEALAPEVAAWEPHAALVDEGHTEALVRAAASELASGGWLAVEIHAERTEAVVNLFAAAGLVQVVITPDLAGRARVVEGAKA
jgi:release factor glutamine methyltransferase